MTEIKWTWDEAVRIMKEMKAACKTSEDHWQLAKYLDNRPDWHDIIADYYRD